MFGMFHGRAKLVYSQDGTCVFVGGIRPMFSDTALAGETNYGTILIKLALEVVFCGEIRLPDQADD